MKRIFSLLLSLGSLVAMGQPCTFTWNCTSTEARICQGSINIPRPTFTVTAPCTATMSWSDNGISMGAVPPVITNLSLGSHTIIFKLTCSDGRILYCTKIYRVYPSLTANILSYPENQIISQICWGEDATLRMDGVPATCQVIWDYSTNNGSTWNPLPGGGAGNPYHTNQINWSTLPCTGATVSHSVKFRGTVNPNCLNLPLPWPANCQNSKTKDLTVWCPSVGGTISLTSTSHTIQPGNRICSDNNNDSNPNYPVNISLALTGNIGTILGWTRSPGPNPSSTASIITDQIIAPGNYTYTVTVRNGPTPGGCASTTSQISIIVEDPPGATLASDETEVCWGKDAQLSLSNIHPAGATIQWQYQINCIGPWITTWVSGTVQNTNEMFGPSFPSVVPPTALPCEPNKICWRAILSSPTGICDPVPSNFITINVIVPPNAPTISPSAPPVKCVGVPIPLTAPVVCGTGPLTYQWFLNGVSLSSGGATIQAIEPGNYYVVVSNRNNCASTQSTNTVTVRDCITKVVIEGPCTCVEGRITLTANPSSFVVPPGPPPSPTCGGPYTYLWSTGATTQSISLECPWQTTTYSVTVRNAMGCTTTVSHTIKKCKK